MRVDVGVCNDRKGEIRGSKAIQFKDEEGYWRETVSAAVDPADRVDQRANAPHIRTVSKSPNKPPRVKR